jgi:hypothetical protein
MGLWPAWRRDQEQHQAAVVEDQVVTERDDIVAWIPA